MRTETIAIHAGYQGDPSVRAVAVPIYQTVAYEFESAEHAAALFNLEAKAFAIAGSPTRPTRFWSSVLPRWKAG